ncbi:hypothetical protein C4S76_07830 [Apibacter adventoris]|nr:hypothetical protein C4S76_07830 [Apibacter adventoris]
MRKILLFMSVLFIFNTYALASGSPSAKANYLQKNFVSSTTSNYDAMDVFGILSFLMQYSNTIGKYNYEVANLTWKDIEDAISGNPDDLINKITTSDMETPPLTWKASGNHKVLTRIQIYQNFYGTFNGSYFKNLELLEIIQTNISSIDVATNYNLSNLICYSNKITSLDLSHNSNLEFLDCNGNQLTSLDLSKNPKLKSLICYENKLSAINLSNNLNLKVLVCNTNLLNSLDLSYNNNLEYLDCEKNKLTSLNLPKGKNTNLNKILCDENQISSLDVTPYTNLELLACNNNQLTSLNLSNNPNLKELKCNNNQLTSLDLSHNPILEFLDCNNNQLTSLDLSNVRELLHLNCYDNLLKFSTLKGDFSNLKYGTLSKLGPQAIWKGGTKGFLDLIDLSSEYNIHETLTTYTWYDKTTNQKVAMFASNGAFYPGPGNKGKTLLCKMTNALYPNLDIEYEVTITNSMIQDFSAKNRDFKIPDNFTLTGPEVETSNLKVYPNPVIDVLKINTPSQIESVSIYDYSGNEVKKVSPVINKEVNLQGLSSGNYILTIKTSQGTITKKIIKK